VWTGEVTYTGAGNLQSMQEFAGTPLEGTRHSALISGQALCCCNWFCCCDWLTSSARCAKDGSRVSNQIPVAP
jgi:hypothetical protein